MTLDSSSLNYSSKALVIILMCIGSTFFISLVPLVINYFTLRRAKSRGGISLTPARDVYLEQTALAKLLLLVPAYFFLHLLFAYLVLVIYSLVSPAMQAQLQEDRLNPWVSNLFLAVRLISESLGAHLFAYRPLRLQTPASRHSRTV